MAQQLPAHRDRERLHLEALPDRSAVPCAGNARSGSSDAVSAQRLPVNRTALADLSAVLEKEARSRKLNVSVVLDASLIGGIRMVVGDEMLDTAEIWNKMKTAPWHNAGN